MRALILLAGASFLLAACGKNDQTDKTRNVDENLTAENIVSNDVTAIDAVTGDAANMAADVDMNFGALDANGAAAISNVGSAQVSATRSKPAARKPAPEPQANSSANAAANAQ
ncbi:MAG: hypothetical protein QOD54_359 [Sphingomonadales bacterium]|nr:hypothetical protein [Sphingomonadales bacterium]